MKTETKIGTDEWTENVRVHFGVVLKALRSGNNLTQEGLAELSSTEANFISKIERGERQPTIAKIFCLAHGLGVEPSELIRMVQASIDGKLDLSPRIVGND